MDCFMSRKDYDKRKGLTDYYYFLGGLTDEEIELIKSISENYTVEEGTTGKAVHPNYRNSKIRWLPKDNKTEWLYKKLGALAKQANNDYWGFDIVGFGEYLQYGEYNSNVSGFNCTGSLRFKTLTIALPTQECWPSLIIIEKK